MTADEVRQIVRDELRQIEAEQAAEAEALMPSFLAELTKGVKASVAYAQTAHEQQNRPC